MNKRQKKKLYKKKTGKNPPKQLHYSGKEYHKAIRKPWGGEKPLENYSWESEEVKRAVAKAAKAFTVKETVERLKNAICENWNKSAGDFGTRKLCKKYREYSSHSGKAGATKKGRKEQMEMNRSAAEAQENREKILKYIAGYIKAHCYPPAIYEIAKETGLSKQTVHRHMKMMIEDHILETDSDMTDSRAYRIKGTKIVMVKEKKDAWK